MNRTIFLVTAATALSFGTLAAAQTAPTPAASARPARINPDTNGDNAVSRAEAQAAAELRWTQMDVNRDGRLDQADWQQVRTQRRAELFTALDTDGNGSVSRAEWDQAADARAARMGERMARRGEGEGRGERHGRRGRGHGGGHGGGMAMLARLDTNRDRVITREEFFAAVTERHAALDTNSDGSVTTAERAAGRGQRGRQR